MLTDSHHGNRICSCTSCFYESQSCNPSVQQMLKEGSRIDRLFLGKYIPLRERNLLKKLTRTRAVYNDINCQLGPESGTCIDASYFAPRQQSQPRCISLDGEATSAIFELVELLKNNRGCRLHDSCNCCSCDAIDRNEHSSNKRRQRHTYGESSRSMGQCGVCFKDRPTKSEPYVRASKKTGEMIKKYSRNIIKRLRSERESLEQSTDFPIDDHNIASKKIKHPKHNIQEKESQSQLKQEKDKEPKTKEVKTKHKKAHKRSGEIIRQFSRNVVGKLRTEQQSVDQLSNVPVDDKNKTFKKEKHPKRIQTHTRSKSQLTQSLKTNETKKDNKKIGATKINKSAKKSDTKQLHAATKKSINKIQQPYGSYELDKTSFLIRKDSVTKYKDELERRRRQYVDKIVYKYKPCKSTSSGCCYPGECDPNECFRILENRRRKRRRTEKRRWHDYDAKKNSDAESYDSNISFLKSEKETTLKNQKMSDVIPILENVGDTNPKKRTLKIKSKRHNKFESEKVSIGPSVDSSHKNSKIRKEIKKHRTSQTELAKSVNPNKTRIIHMQTASKKIKTTIQSKTLPGEILDKKGTNNRVVSKIITIQKLNKRKTSEGSSSQDKVKDIEKRQSKSHFQRIQSKSCECILKNKDADVFNAKQTNKEKLKSLNNKIEKVHHENAPKNIRHSLSSISFLIEQSKHNLKKHRLRKCFCKLKLINRSRHGTLPYEFETELCDPNMCLKLNNKLRMQQPHRHGKRSSSEYRRIQSISSFTQTIDLNKLKKIHSSPIRENKIKTPRKVASTSSGFVHKVITENKKELKTESSGKARTEVKSVGSVGSSVVKTKTKKKNRVVKGSNPKKSQKKHPSTASKKIQTSFQSKILPDVIRNKKKINKQADSKIDKAAKHNIRPKSAKTTERIMKQKNVENPSSQDKIIEIKKPTSKTHITRKQSISCECIYENEKTAALGTPKGSQKNILKTGSKKNKSFYQTKILSEVILDKNNIIIHVDSLKESLKTTQRPNKQKTLDKPSPKDNIKEIKKSQSKSLIPRFQSSSCECLNYSEETAVLGTPKETQKNHTKTSAKKIQTSFQSKILPEMIPDKNKINIRLDSKRVKTSQRLIKQRNLEKDDFSAVLGTPKASMRIKNKTVSKQIKNSNQPKILPESISDKNHINKNVDSKNVKIIDNQKHAEKPSSQDKIKEIEKLPSKSHISRIPSMSCECIYSNEKTTELGIPKESLKQNKIVTKQTKHPYTSKISPESIPDKNQINKHVDSKSLKITERSNNQKHVEKPSSQEKIKEVEKPPSKSHISHIHNEETAVLETPKESHKKITKTGSKKNKTSYQTKILSEVLPDKNNIIKHVDSKSFKTTQKLSKRPNLEKQSSQDKTKETEKLQPKIHVSRIPSMSCECINNKEETAAPSSKPTPIAKIKSIISDVKTEQNQNTHKNLRFKRSHSSVSTKQAKRKVKKHRLRRCFCTFKLFNRSRDDSAQLPDVCDAGVCNPDMRLSSNNRIQMQHTKGYTKRPSTFHRQIKSTSNITQTTKTNNPTKLSRLYPTRKKKLIRLKQITSTTSSPIPQSIKNSLEKNKSELTRTPKKAKQRNSRSIFKGDKISTPNIIKRKIKRSLIDPGLKKHNDSRKQSLRGSKPNIPIKTLSKQHQTTVKSKKRQTITDRSKVKSVSSLTHKSSPPLLVLKPPPPLLPLKQLSPPPRYRQKSIKSFSLKQPKIILSSRSMKKRKRKKNLAPIVHLKIPRQTVRYGSSISFNIEFTKYTTNKRPPSFIEDRNVKTRQTKIYTVSKVTRNYYKQPTENTQTQTHSMRKVPKFVNDASVELIPITRLEKITNVDNVPSLFNSNIILDQDQEYPKNCLNWDNLYILSPLVYNLQPATKRKFFYSPKIKDTDNENVKIVNSVTKTECSDLENNKITFSNPYENCCYNFTEIKKCACDVCISSEKDRITSRTKLKSRAHLPDELKMKPTACYVKTVRNLYSLSSKVIKTNEGAINIREDKSTVTSSKPKTQRRHKIFQAVFSKTLLLKRLIYSSLDLLKHSVGTTAKPVREDNNTKLYLLKRIGGKMKFFDET